MRKLEKGRLSFRAVEVFIAAIEEGSILAAAKRLGASASAVSSQMSNLEEVLDARLIERSAHRFELTPAGEIFGRRARSIIDEVTGAKIELASAKHAPKMDIRIAVIEDFDHEILPDLLRRLQTHYPQGQFRVQSGASHESHASLSSRGVDLIVAADNTSQIDWIDEYEILHDPYIMVAASPDMATSSIDEMMQHPFVRYSQEQLIGLQIEAQLRRTKNIPPRKFECSSNQAVFSMVQNFNGWAITTATAYLGTMKSEAGNGKTLYPASLPIPSFARTISVYSRRDTMGEIPANFAKCLKESLNEGLIAKTKTELPFLDGTLHLL